MQDLLLVTELRLTTSVCNEVACDNVVREGKAAEKEEGGVRRRAQRQ